MGATAFLNWFDGLKQGWDRLWHGISDKYLGTNYQATEAADVAWQRQLDMWNMTNAYNDPSAMMQRLRNAGLNPDLAMGSPVNVSAEAGQPPVAQTGRGSGNPISDFMSLRLNQANLDLLRAQQRDLEASAGLKSEQAESERSLRDARYRNLEAATSNLVKQNEGIQANIERLSKENQLTGEQISKIKFDRMMAGKYFRLDSERLRNETAMTQAEIAKLDADKKLALAKAHVTEREYNEMLWTYAVRYSHLEKQVQLSDAQIEQAKATARKLGMDSDILSGTAAFESDMSSSMKRGGVEGIIALTRYGIQAVTRDFGNLLGGFGK